MTHNWKCILGVSSLAVIGLVLIAYFAVNAWCIHLLPRTIIWGSNTQKKLDLSLDPAPGLLQQLGVAHQLRLDVGPPEASLLAWVMEPTGQAVSSTQAPRGTVFLLHGIRDRKESMLPLARVLAANGFRAVLVDLRCNGRSSGEWVTFGVLDSRDMAQLFAALQERGWITPPVGVLGVSYGAATAIQWAERDPRVAALVAVASFRSMRDVVPRYLRLFLPGLGALLRGDRIQLCIDEAGRVAGFDPDEASPLRAIARVHSPVLVVHGEADWKIPWTHARDLYRAAAGPKRLLLIPGAGHDNIMADRDGTIRRAYLAWFNRWLGLRADMKLGDQ